jgi:hypothetical protein
VDEKVQRRRALIGGLAVDEKAAPVGRDVVDRIEDLGIY